MMRFPRFLQFRRRPHGAHDGMPQLQRVHQPAPPEYNPVRAQFERECG